MKDLNCLVYDEDKFTRELILSFIEKTAGVKLVSNSGSSKIDVVFVDGELNPKDLQSHLSSDTHVVIISSNKTFVHSIFKESISDYLYKPQLNYERFLSSINKIKSKKDLRNPSHLK